ncbi:GNAT family N-acetyltransferase [Marinicella meishanensis]|uniref:GNAT family N-acetyltransferase n=1 Tax=Marinicella meishanensis TaxID=2873263 RepID=UPI001CBD9622|nr:GNAT family N-acetyltransferase [Marinicella sp. NBU2979]
MTMQIPDSTRLSFALMDDGDADLLYQLDQDVEVMRYINGGKITTREDIHNTFLPRLAQYRNPEKGWGLWQLTVTETGQYIGWLLVRPMGFFGDDPQWTDWELGWRLFRSAWGHGYATEAASHLMQELASTQDVSHFSAIAMPGNAASIKVMEKLGMRYQKTGIHSDPLGDEEVVYYSKRVC